MCHQSVGLIQSVIEKSGIPTVSISVLREVTERVRPPRALFVDRPLGFPLGHAGNASLQEEIVTTALEMLSDPVGDLVVREFVERVTQPRAGERDP